MTASFARPANVIPFGTSARASIDCLDEAERMLIAAGEIGAAANTLWAYPTNANALSDARQAALTVLNAVARIEASQETVQ